MKTSTIQTNVEIHKDSYMIVRATELQAAGKMPGKDYFVLKSEKANEVEIHHIVTKEIA